MSFQIITEKVQLTSDIFLPFSVTNTAAQTTCGQIAHAEEKQYEGAQTEKILLLHNSNYNCYSTHYLLFQLLIEDFNIQLICTLEVCFALRLLHAVL